MSPLPCTAPCVIACESKTGGPISFLQFWGKSIDKMPRAAEFAAQEMIRHALDDNHLRVLLNSTFIHFTSDGFPASSFRFEKNSNEENT